MPQRYKKKFEEKEIYNIEKYTISFNVRNNKIYVDEEVQAKDTKIKAEFLKRVQPFNNDIFDFLKDFNDL